MRVKERGRTRSELSERRNSRRGKVPRHSQKKKRLKGKWRSGK